METKTRSKATHTSAKQVTPKAQETNKSHKTPFGFYLMMGGLAAMLVYLVVLALTI